MKVKLTKPFLLVGKRGFTKGYVFKDEIPASKKLSLVKNGHAAIVTDDLTKPDPSAEADAETELKKLAALDDLDGQGDDEQPEPHRANDPEPSIRKPKPRA